METSTSFQEIQIRAVLEQLSTLLLLIQATRWGSRLKLLSQQELPSSRAVRTSKH